MEESKREVERSDGPEKSDYHSLQVLFNDTRNLDRNKETRRRTRRITPSLLHIMVKNTEENG
jgi:hypothetical protein